MNAGPSSTAFLYCSTASASPPASAYASPSAACWFATPAAVEVGLDVAGVDLHRGVERLERLLRLAEEGAAEPVQVVRIGEGAPRREHLLEEVHRAVVVLEGEALARLLDVALRIEVGCHRLTPSRVPGSTRWCAAGPLRAGPSVP